ncbi:hypothetical protein [Limnohabitans sp. Jir72]|nr:hypothetical protein [Limnohabitans sp. Jir72]
MDAPHPQRPDVHITQSHGSVHQDQGQWLVITGDASAIQVQWTSMP